MTAVDVDALGAARAAAHIVANWTVNFSPDQPDALENMIAATVAPLLAEVRRGRALREAVEGLAEDWDRTAAIFPEYGDLSAAAARSLRDVLAAADGTP